jgi:hypothetical protein
MPPSKRKEMLLLRGRRQGNVCARLRVIKEHVDFLREFMEKLRRKFN